jgi:hypothetical protein
MKAFTSTQTLKKRFKEKTIFLHLCCHYIFYSNACNWLIDQNETESLKQLIVKLILHLNFYTLPPTENIYVLIPSDIVLNFFFFQFFKLNWNYGDFGFLSFLNWIITFFFVAVRVMKTHKLNDIFGIMCIICQIRLYCCSI